MKKTPKITDILSPAQIKLLSRAGYLICDPGSIIVVTAEHGFDRQVAANLPPDEIEAYMAQVKCAVLAGLRSRVPDEAITSECLSGPWGSKVSAECFVIVSPRVRPSEIN